VVNLPAPGAAVLEDAVNEDEGWAVSFSLEDDPQSGGFNLIHCSSRGS
jgi:hypothetical protein